MKKAGSHFRPTTIAGAGITADTTIRQIKEILGPVSAKTGTERRKVAGSSIPVLCSHETADAEIAVLTDGYVVYRTKSNYCTFLISDASGYVYKYCDGTESSLTNEQMDSMSWIMLSVFAEDIIEKNANADVAHRMDARDFEECAMPMSQTEADPESIVIERDRIGNAVAVLTPHQKCVAYARFVEGRSCEEIGTSLNCTRQAVSKTASQIVKKWRKVFTEYSA